MAKSGYLNDSRLILPARAGDPGRLASEYHLPTGRSI
jgi:hypothetical protein